MSFSLYSNLCAFAQYVHHHVDLHPSKEAQPSQEHPFQSSLASSLGIDPSTLLIRESRGPTFSSFGAPSLFGRIALHFDPAASPGAQKYLLLRELFLLKNQSHFWRWIVPLVLSVSLAIFTYSFSTLFIADLVGYGTSVGATALLHWITAYRADSFALAHAGKEERAEARAYLEAQLAVRQKERLTSPLKRVYITAQGDYRINLFAPSLSSRVARLVP